MDGLPYELWKELNQIHNILAKKNKESFDIIKALTMVFNDIQMHGVADGTNFNLGWMCPIYKKNERDDIANYRPITLMNTDYKLLTKAMAIKLSKHATQMVNEDQAGFIPNRSIFDLIRLSKAMINYAEAMEEDGAIIALDQEKAYDRVDHNYLWATLRAFNLPEGFVNTVKSLYTNAHTIVAINGVFSSPFCVTRGVRQGDPLSCLLFDLAIEPLAEMLRQSPDLRGYQIPGMTKKTLITLFADDATIYLSARDKYKDLEKILFKWCDASGAKFNIAKTEIIPIGSKEHRDRVIRTRQIHPDDRPLTPGIRIARDGEATRSLGALIGNKVDIGGTWEPKLDKISDCLDRWLKSHPNLDAKRLIVQMIVGGMTQYFTKVQGMPSSIEDAVIKIIRQFMWPDSKSPPIGMTHLYKPREEGGLGLLDIKARNEAISLTWLKAWLSLSPDRPAWAFAEDALINKYAPEGSNTCERVNTLLQTWDVPVRGGKLPKETTEMLRIGRKHGVTFAAVKLSQSMKNSMPAWMHLGAPARTYYRPRDQCLKDNHTVKLVHDLHRVARRAKNETAQRHTKRQNCACKECKDDRTRGCQDPNACSHKAAEILTKIAGKFNNQNQPINDGLTLTHRRREKNATAQAKKGAILFDPSLTAKTSLSECFRVFVNKERLTNEPAHRVAAPTRGLAIQEESVTVYTDGSCMNNGKANAQCGSGVWFGEGDNRNLALRIPGEIQSNQVGEVAAVIAALKSIEDWRPVHIRTDSMYVINALTKDLQNMEDRGWIGVANANLLRAAAYQCRKRSAPVSLEWVKGHSGDPGNDGADKLASEGANKEELDEIDTYIPASFDVQGAKLTVLTQAQAYRGIKDREETTKRRGTNITIGMTQAALEEYTGAEETEASIWNGSRHPDMRRETHRFIYRAMHRSYRIGPYWMHTDKTHLANCPSCEVEEDLTHILCECSEPSRQIIWQMASKLWPHEQAAFPELSLGIILGCGNLKVYKQSKNRNRKRREQKPDIGASRLLRILISEAAYLIWVIRCERVYSEKIHSTRAILTRFANILDRRLRTDQVIASKLKRTEKSIKAADKTWRPLVEKLTKETLPENWANNLHGDVRIATAMARSFSGYQTTQNPHLTG